MNDLQAEETAEFIINILYFNSSTTKIITLNEWKVVTWVAYQITTRHYITIHSILGKIRLRIWPAILQILTCQVSWLRCFCSTLNCSTFAFCSLFSAGTSETCFLK